VSVGDGRTAGTGREEKMKGKEGLGKEREKSEGPTLSSYAKASSRADRYRKASSEILSFPSRNGEGETVREEGSDRRGQDSESAGISKGRR
jgi:hypothetical protein